MAGGLVVGAMMLVVAVAVFVSYQVTTRQALARDALTAFTLGVSRAVAPALDDGDVESVGWILPIFSDIPGVTGVQVFDRVGDLVASFGRTQPDPSPLTAGAPGTRILTRPGQVTVITTVDHLGDTVGHVRLSGTVPTTAQTLRAVAPVVSLSALVGLMLVALAIRLLGRQLTRPLHALTGAASTVARTHRYDVRVPEHGATEVVALARAFNTMIGEVQNRDSLLERARATLESRVRERTLALRAQIAERQRAESDRAVALRERQRIMDTVADVIYALDVRGHLTTFNTQLERATGRSPEELDGLNALELFMPEDRPAIEEGIYRSLTAGHAQASGRLVHVDGHTTWYEFTGQIMRSSDGEILGLTGTGRDVEAQRRAQEEIRRLNAQLEKRVAERTAALEAANRELEAFSYSASHDLRTPLRSIDGFSRALLEDFGDTLDPVARGYLDRVRAAAARMAALIDDMLHLSRVTRAQMDSAPVNLSDLATRVAARLAEAHPERQVQFSAQPGLRASGDSRLLEALFENLLGNAWKFTANNPDAAVRFGHTTDAATPAWFVRDNGVGFDMRQATRLFRPFERLHGEREFAGTGIGLATVQRIVERHGGRVWAEAQPGVGATIYFTLGAN